MAGGLTLGRRGRHRRNAPRDKRGRILYGHDRERPDEILATALLARQRHAGAREIKVKVDGRIRKVSASDPLWGYALGRLYLGHLQRGEGITLAQHNAGCSFAELHACYCRLKGTPLPNLKSPGMGMVAAGLSCSPEPDPEVIESLFERHSRAVFAVLDASDHAAWRMLFQTAIRDLMPDSPPELDYLRRALDALCRHWRIA